MAFADLLINTCIVRRWTSISVDTYGNPVKTWAALPVAQLCRLSSPRSESKQVQRDTEVVPVDMVLFTEDIDITEYDRVIVDGTEFEILFVAHLQNGAGAHHLELSLKRVIP